MIVDQPLEKIAISNALICKVFGLKMALANTILLSASTKRAHLSVATKVVRPTDLLNNVRY